MVEQAWANINTLWSHVLIDELARGGIRYAVVSPGSRSTPLVMAVAAHPDIDDISIIDERSAAFFALGVARATGRAVALICTSGTAAANYFPAICEAAADDVPLLVLTADRPVDLRASGASQAMDQLKLYGDHVRWFHQLGQPELDARRIRALRSTVGLGLRHTTWPVAGPVHLNVPFRKPLEPTAVDDDDRDGVPAVDAWPRGLRDAVYGVGVRHAAFETPVMTPSSETLAGFVDTLRAAQRPVILAGADARGATYADDLARLALALGIPVLAEPTSGLRFLAGHHDAILGGGDLLLRAGLYDEVGEPDLIVQLGEPPLHWAARSLCRQADAARRIVVTPSGRRLEPEHHPTTFIVADTSALARAAWERARRLALEEQTTSWLALHQRASRRAAEALDASIAAQDELHEARIWRELAANLPDDAGLFVSNSMPIRHFDTFTAMRERRLLPYFNRGLNGIDGVLSTGLGAAFARTVPTSRGEKRSRFFIVCGDVAFRHDIGAILSARRHRIDATVVICDNAGGAIFEALPVSEFPEVFERHFLTPPGIPDASSILGVEVVEPEDWSAFREAIGEDAGEPGLRLVRVRTDRERDRALAEVHLERAAQAVRSVAADWRGRGAVERQARPLRAAAGASGGAQAPVVALHGFTGRAQDWLRHAGALPNYRMVAWDLPGHGSEPTLGAGSGLDEAVDWLAAKWRARGLERAHLVGYSMGGRLAMAFARAHPDAVSSLCLIGAHPGLRAGQARRARAAWDEKMAAALEREGLHAFVDRWMQLDVLASQLDGSHAGVVAARQTRLGQSAEGLAWALRALGAGAQSPLWDSLASLGCPVSFVAGAHDAKYVALGHELAAKLPSLKLHIIAEAGHNPLWDQPEDTIRALRDHLDGAPTR